MRDPGNEDARTPVVCSSFRCVSCFRLGQWGQSPENAGGRRAASATSGIRETKGSFQWHTDSNSIFFPVLSTFRRYVAIIFYCLNLDQSWGLTLPKPSWPVSNVLQNLTELSSLPVQVYTAADRRSQDPDKKQCVTSERTKKNKERNSWLASELHFGKKGFYPSV